MTTLFTGGAGTALAVTDGVITWTGAVYPGTPTEVVDLAGGLLTPAFVDAHVHATSAGLLRTGLDLTEVGSLGDLLDAVRDRVREQPDTLLWGHGWDETRFAENRPPTRAELDAVAGATAVYLSRIDVHSALASSALVDLAPGARAAAGWSDGPLARDAHHHVRRAALESITPDQRRAAQLAFLRHAASMGIACVHECGGPDISGREDLAGLLALSGDLPRVIGYWGERGVRVPGAHGLAGDLFVDGAFGSRTAALREPYTDRPDTSGARYLDADQIAEHLVTCTETGIQAGFHVIGDAATAAVVAGFRGAAEVLGETALAGARHRLEHLEMITAREAAELARYRVVASVQPLFDALWGGQDGMYVQRLGRDRAATLNPFAMMAAEGLTLAFGSDAPVTPVDPWATVWAGVHHRTPGSGLSQEAAFAAHTAGGWAAAGETGGVLEVGAPATFAVWDVPDLVDGLPPVDSNPTCLRTVLDGTTIYHRSERDGVLATERSE